MKAPIVLKYNPVLFLLLLLFNGSGCETGCNDCGSIDIKEVSVSNRTGHELSISLYKGGVVKDFAVIGNGDTLLVRKEGTPVAVSPGGVLKDVPYQKNAYDSVRYSSNSRVYGYRPSDCIFSGNILCESNYVTLKDQKDKNGNHTLIRQINILSLK